MAFQTKDLYSTRHAAIVATLKGAGFPSSGDWANIVKSAKLLATDDGFDVGHASATVDIRTMVEKAKKDKKDASTAMLAGAAISTTTPLSAAAAARLGALETLRHLWLKKRFGSHKVWVLSLPMSYSDWPEADLVGKTAGDVAIRMNDENTRFSASDRKHLSDATQEGLKWVHKAMIVSASPKTKKNNDIIRRWFADVNSKDEDIIAVGATLNAGLKKIAKTIKSSHLVFTDMPMNRIDPSKANVNAFVFSDEKIDAIYVERAFFGDGDMFKDLKNWTRITVHEISHREVKTKDYRYRHHGSGLKPDAADVNFTAAKALDNADSWALFCMDCAGQLTDGDYKKVKVA